MLHQRNLDSKRLNFYIGLPPDLFEVVAVTCQLASLTIEIESLIIDLFLEITMNEKNKTKRDFWNRKEKKNVVFLVLTCSVSMFGVLV